MLRDKYWAVYTEKKFKTLYYGFFQAMAKRIDGALNGICLFATITSVGGLTLGAKIPILWSAIIIIAQLIQVFKPLLPFHKQIIALKFLVPELQSLMNEIDRDLGDFHTKNERKQIALIYEYEKRYTDLNNQFIGDTYFPDCDENCYEKAAKEWKKFFFQRYNVRMEVNDYAQEIQRPA